MLRLQDLMLTRHHAGLWSSLLSAQGLNIHMTNTLICLIKDNEIVIHVNSTFSPSLVASEMQVFNDTSGAWYNIHHAQKPHQDLHSIQWQELFTSVAAMTWQLRDTYTSCPHAQTVFFVAVHWMLDFITNIPHSIHKHFLYHSGKNWLPQRSQRH